MKKKNLLHIFSLLFAVSLLVAGCGPKERESLPDPAFSRYIAAFTAGEISSEAPVVIRLVELPALAEPGKPLPDGLFRFTPAVKGEARVTENGSIEFRPAKPLENGVKYSCTFMLGKLMPVDKPFREFRFSFSTIEQNFRVETDGLYSAPGIDPGIMSWKGGLVTADVAAPETVEQLVEASYLGKKVKLVWFHAPDRKNHVFTADSLVRNSTRETPLTVAWNGKPLGVKQKGLETIVVPAKNQFVILSIKVLQKPEQQLEVRFSDPLATDQSFEGMVDIEGCSGYAWQTEGNRLTLWPSEKLSGMRKVTVFKGIRSAGQASLGNMQVFEVPFRNQKPAVRLLGKGVIVPDQNSLSFPFEAVSLKAVDFRVIKIYASNIRQFLQENRFDGGEDLKKVGRLVYSGKVDLKPDNPELLHQWSTYRIDLNRYITLEEGAIYRVEIRFRKAYSLYECAETTSAGNRDEEADAEGGYYSNDQEDWDAPGWYNLYWWPRNYRWQERDNPCHDSYYTSERFVSRNIFASNLGVLAKEGKGNRFTFVVTNLKTARPESGVEISVFDFQHQLLGKVSTDNNGMVSGQFDRKPFVLVAKKNKQTAYLRLDDGSSLSLSNFDVSGEVVQEGVKGFLYGERGVWRPGDKMFLTFILDDPDNRFPENTPVIFRLINPRGQEVERRVETAGPNGFYHFQVTTRPDDPTGNWYARVQVGGALFERRLKVETVKPNRLKIDLKTPGLIQAGSSQSATLQAQWLHGATARSLKAVVEADFGRSQTVFKNYEKFTFDNPAALFEPVKQKIFDGQLDENGQVRFPLGITALSKVPGKLKLYLTTRVFEPGGDFSTGFQAVDFSPFPKYLGVRMPDEADNWYQTGVDYQPELVALSPDGKPLPLGRVEVSLYKIDWRWWWESGPDQLAHYVNGQHYRPVKQWMLNSGNATEKLQLNIQYNDWRDNGRYLLFARDPENGHATGVTFYVSKYGSWRSEDMPEGATMLALRTDKEKYSPGDRIRVSIPSSQAGRALVSLEDGKAVKDIFWVETSQNETSFDIDVKPGMAPTLYIHVSLIQPFGSTLNDAPLRLYGVTAVAVEDPQTVLQPVIQMKEEIEPGQEFSVTVKEQSGRPMTYTLAIVDEGLLDLTGFKTPDPHAAFFAREALGVKTYDLFDYVAGAYGAQLEKAFAVGGDQALLQAGKKKENRFEPVVLYAGPFTLGKGSKKTHTFRMPNYVGSVKTMVVAGTPGAYGNAEQAVKVRKALMLLATLPRVAGPGEELSVPVSVFAMKESVRQVTVEAEASGLFAVAGNAAQTLQFGAPGDQMAWFTLKTAAATGTGKVKITARSGNETAVYEATLEVRNPNPPVTLQQSRLLEPGQAWSAEMQEPGMKGTNSAFLEITSLPGLNLTERLDELVQYPHGCAEQIISGGFGQLFLENMTKLPAEEKLRIEENIRSVLQRLHTFQTADGGFSTWPGNPNSDEWTSSYGGHFMILAEQKGFSVPGDLKNRWLNYQRTRARIWKPAAGDNPFVRQQYALLQGYRLYSLALAGAPETGVMNRFREEIGGNPQARWRLAAAYQLAGQRQVARQLIQQQPETMEAYLTPGISFGSDLRDKAMMLEALLLLDDRQAAFPLLREIAGEIGNSTWLSTQTAGWCFYAISKFYGNGQAATSWEAKVTVNGKTELKRSSLPADKQSLSWGANGKAAVKVENSSQTPLFVRVIAQGVPLEDPSGEMQNGLQLTTAFTDSKGARIDPARLPQGTDLFLEVTVRHPGVRGGYQNLALTTVFPSGWEILNRRLGDLPETETRKFDFQDIRDDRVYTYFSLNTGESRTFRLALNAAYRGRYYLPAVSCEAMYDNSVMARVPGQWVVVKEQ